MFVPLIFFLPPPSADEEVRRKRESYIPPPGGESAWLLWLLLHINNKLIELARAAGMIMSICPSAYIYILPLDFIRNSQQQPPRPISCFVLFLNSNNTLKTNKNNIEETSHLSL
jgi:hypothetical protein